MIKEWYDYEVELLSEKDKQSIYFGHYLPIQLELNHDIHIVDKYNLTFNKDWKHGWGEPIVELNTIAIYRTARRKRYIPDFMEFCNNFLNQWYWRFKNEFKLSIKV